jgi:polyphosphate kinase
VARWFGNRELSWLDFNDRVLAMAREQSLPLLERVKFCAIYSSNLDEFFQVRVAGLKGQIDAGVHSAEPDAMTPSRQLAEIAERVRASTTELENVLAHVLLPELEMHGVALLRWQQLSADERARASDLFMRQMFPVLTPLAVDPAHPFPYISNLALSLGVFVRDPVTDERRFARVKVPTFLKRFHEVSEGRWVPVEDIIEANMGSLFSGMLIESCAAFRVTRNADLTLEDEDADDLLAAVEMELRRRRFGKAVRLEVDRDIDPEILATLLDELELTAEDVYRHTLALGLASLWELNTLDRPELKDVPWTSVDLEPATGPDRIESSMFAAIRERDILAHHPYVSFSSSTEEFIDQAAEDPMVQSIKVTLYRTSGESPIARSLIKAAERGKQVAAMIELTARFDEAVNVDWAKRLERSGVHVVYGVVGLKTHSKCVLVVRQEDSGLRRYVHIGTGNYNSRTARTYEDIGLITCDETVGEDVSRLFNHLTGFSRADQYARIVVAPDHLRPTIADLIRLETAHGPAGRITMKVNAIADREIVDLLYGASEAGVKIDLIVRGICCLKPDPEHGANITVRSVLGRYLEHSRIYRFGHGAPDGGPAWFVGSADMMPRNLDKRVEVLVPVREPRHQHHLDAVCDVLLSDEVAAFEMDPFGRWRRRGPGEFTAANDAQALIHGIATFAVQRGLSGGIPRP